MTEPENQLSVIPPPLEGDDDDVAWALQTASVQWKRGARADAIVWLRRAVDSAVELGQHERAQQINQTIVEVEELIVQTVFGRPPTEPPAAGSPEIDALIGLPPGRASIDVEFDDQIAFDDREESTTVMEQPELPPEPTPEGAFPPPWQPQHAVRPPPPAEPAFPPSAPPPPPLPAPEKKVRRVRPPPPPSAMPRPPSVAPPEAVIPRAVEVDLHAAVPDIRDSRSDLEPTIKTRHPASSAPPPAVPLPPISYSVLDPASVPEPQLEQPTVTQPLASPEPLAAVTQPLASPEPLSAEPSPPAPPPEPEPEAAEDDEPRIRGVKLADVAGLQDLPPEAQAELVRTARLETLDVDEEVGSFGVALVVEGWASVMPAIADAACAFAQPGEVVFTQGSLATAVALRIVAGETDTVVAVWERDALEKATADCPWVADELRAVADRFQALAGAAMGPLGDRLDDTLRQSVTDRCEVRTYAAGDFVVEEGDAVPGMFVVGAGEVELLGPDGSITTALGPGDFLFASEVMAGAPAAATVRAGSDGALMLFASRHTAHELMLSVPPLLELLAG